MFFTYILNSLKTNGYYIGATSNLQRRIADHNKGLVKSTKYGKPWRLVYIENYETLSGARKREARLKSWKKRLAIERLISRNRGSTIAEAGR